MQQPVWWGERHQSLQFGFLRVGGGTIWQVASSRIATRSIALPVFSTSSTSNNHYLPHLCCAPCEHHTLNIITEVSAPLPAQGKAIFFPGLWSAIAHSDPTFGLEEQERIIDWRRWCTRRKTAQCAMCQEKTVLHNDLHQLYTRGSTYTTHYQFRASTPETPLYYHCPASFTQNFLAEAASDRPTFMVRGTKICSSVAPHKTRMHRKVRQGCNMKTCLMHYSLED